MERLELFTSVQESPAEDKETRILEATQMTEWALPPHANARGIVFGGVLVSWMDIAGVAAAQRYARAHVVTSLMDSLQFLAPIKIGSLVHLTAKVIFVGKTSLEVEILVHAENAVLSSTQLAATGLFTYVALDEAGLPKQIPAFSPGCEESARKYQEAQARRDTRKLSRR